MENRKNKGHDPFNQNLWKFRSKTERIGSVQTEKFQKNRSTFRGGPLYLVGLVRSKLTVLFDVFGKILNLSTSLFVTFHQCYVQWLCYAVYVSAFYKQSISREF